MLLQCNSNKIATVAIRLPCFVGASERESDQKSNRSQGEFPLSPDNSLTLSALTALSVCVCVLLLLVCKLHTFLRVSDDSSIEGLRSLSLSLSPLPSPFSGRSHRRQRLCCAALCLNKSLFKFIYWGASKLCVLARGRGSGRGKPIVVRSAIMLFVAATATLTATSTAILL